jgi:hypothetical protein
VVERLSMSRISEAVSHVPGLETHSQRPKRTGYTQ